MKKNEEEIDKIRKAIKEFHERFSKEMLELKESQKETDELIKDLSKRQRKTDEQIKKTDEQQKKTDEQIKKTDEQIKRLFGSQRKTDEQIRKTEQNIGRLTDGWGKFVEGLVEPSIPKLFGEMGINISTIYQRARKRKDGNTLEIDILAIGKRIDGEEVIIAVEVKSTLGVREVKECITDLESFFDFFDEYRGRELMGVVTGIRLTSGVRRYAEREGLYILSPTDETMVILNAKGFKPKIWV